MPITRKQFERGIDTEVEQWMGSISEFLKEFKDQAFTAEEIAERLGETKALDYYHPIHAALDALVRKNVAHQKSIRGKYY